MASDHPPPQYDRPLFRSHPLCHCRYQFSGAIFEDEVAATDAVEEERNVAMLAGGTCLGSVLPRRL